LPSEATPSGVPSGTGFKVIAKAKLPERAKNRKGNPEVHDNARYFAITGHHVDGAPTTVEERQAEIDNFLPPTVASVCMV
jgi:primase-polymerase (primpol)-like protein